MRERLTLNGTIVLLSLAAFASASSMRVADALLPRLAQTHGIGLSAAAEVITFFAVSYGVMQVVFGPLGDRFGKLRAITVACVASALANVACALAPSFPTLLAARAASGAFCACVIPLSMAWIGDNTPYESRQPVLARFLLGQIAGLASGGMAGGFAAGHAYWQWPFLAIAAWFTVAAVALGAAAWRGPSGAQHGSGHPVADMVDVLRRPWARVVAATVFLEGVALFGALAFIASHLHYQRGASLALAGTIFTGFGAGGVVFAFIAKRITGRLGEARLAMAGTFLISTALAAVAWLPWLAAAPVACVVAGFGFYMLHNTLQTNATQMAPERRGAAVALFASCFFFGQSLGVSLTGLLVEPLGTSLAITAGALAILPVGLAFAWRKRAHG